MAKKRSVFFISDSTGITAEVLGESILRHFPNIEFERKSLPYIDSEAKALDAADTIRAASAQFGNKPIIFESLVDENIRDIIHSSNAYCIDVINTFLAPLENELQESCTYEVGRQRVATQDDKYKRRMEAVNFALDNDDGGRLHRYPDADVILIGVSRSGKTPTSLYLAMQFGIFSANYPITDDDLDDMGIPRALKPYKDKLFGLTISPERLCAIRRERLPDSKYASLRQCEQEVEIVQDLFERYNIPYIDTTDVSIEEISTRILADTGITRYFH